jgi:hypothetical protein
MNKRQVVTTALLSLLGAILGGLVGTWLGDLLTR